MLPEGRQKELSVSLQTELEHMGTRSPVLTRQRPCRSVTKVAAPRVLESRSWSERHSLVRPIHHPTGRHIQMQLPTCATVTAVSAEVTPESPALPICGWLRIGTLLVTILPVLSQFTCVASQSSLPANHLLPLSDAAVDAATDNSGDLPSMTDHSVTRWIADLKAGDPDAAEQLASRYFDRLVQLARKHLGNAPRRVADEEDIAISVFHRLCAGADQGRFPKLEDREDLWAVLLTVTKGKVTDQIRHLTRRKRGGGDVRGHSVLGYKANGEPVDFSECVNDELTPEFLTQLDEEHQRLLDMLRDDNHRNIAVWRMEGYSNDEIAERLQISVKSVERKLRHIREKWAGEIS